VIKPHDLLLQISVSLPLPLTQMATSANHALKWRFVYSNMSTQCCFYFTN